VGDLHSLELSDAARSFSLDILNTSDDFLLAWSSRRFGVYGICRWSEEQQDWLVASSLVEGEEYSIDSLDMFNRKNSTDAVELLKLLSLMMASGQVEPTSETSLSKVSYEQELFSRQDRKEKTPTLAPNPPSTDWHQDFLKRLGNWAHKQRIAHETQEITSVISNLEIFNAEGLVPFQAYGSWESHLFYFRYRNGRASLRIGGEDPINAPRWSAAVSYGEPMSGVLSLKEFYYLFYVLGERLTDAPQPYIFQEIGGQEPRSHTVFGFSEAEAHQRIKDLISTWAALGDVIQVKLTDTPTKYLVGSNPPRLLEANPFIPYATEGEASEDNRW